MKDEEWLEYCKNTYPPFNNQESEDDYHYLQRIQKYISYMYMTESKKDEKINRYPLPLLTLFKHTNNIDTSIINASTYISHMDTDIMEEPHDNISFNITSDYTRGISGESIKISLTDNLEQYPTGYMVLLIDNEYYTNIDLEFSKEKVFNYEIQETIHEEGIKHEYHHEAIIIYAIDNDALNDLKENGADYGYPHSQTLKISTYCKYYADYYIDRQHGNDNNTGSTPEEALQNLDTAINNKINQTNEPIIGLISSIIYSVQVNISTNTRIYGLGLYSPTDKGFIEAVNSIIRINKYGKTEISIFKIDTNACLLLKNLLIYKDKEDDYFDCYNNPIQVLTSTNKPRIVSEYEESYLKNYKLYVNNISGDDNNIGFLPDKSYKTVNRALRDNIINVEVIILSTDNVIGEANGRQSDLIIYNDTILKGEQFVNLKNSVLNLYNGKSLITNNVRLVDNEGVVIQDLTQSVFNNTGDSVLIIQGLHNPVLTEVFVDNVNGDDDNNGVTPDTAFKTLTMGLLYLMDKGAGNIVNIISENVDERSKKDEVINYYISNNTRIVGLGKYNPQFKKYDKCDNKLVNCIINLDDMHTLDMEHVQLINKNMKVEQDFNNNPSNYFNNNKHGDPIYLNGVGLTTDGEIPVSLILEPTKNYYILGEQVSIKIKTTNSGTAEPIRLTGELTVTKNETFKQTIPFKTDEEGLALIKLNITEIGDYLVNGKTQPTPKYQEATSTTSFKVRKSEYDYYVDSIRGHDSNTGDTPDNAFKTLEKALKQTGDKSIALINEKTTR